MNAYQAKDLAKQNAKIPKDILKDIKDAAKEGYLSIRYNSQYKTLSQLEMSALKLNGYTVEILSPRKGNWNGPTLYSIRWE